MRGGYFATGIALIAVAVLLTFLPLFDGYNLMDAYEYSHSTLGEIARATDEDARASYSFYMTLVAVDAILAIAGLALMIYGAAAKKD